MNPSTIEPGSVADARALVRDSERIVALTGAGVSAESGVPTFRDAGGLWRNLGPEELASVEALRRDPRTVVEWYRNRREALSGCHPNAAHRALARFFLGRAARGGEPGASGLITQNVDGLHTRAAEEAANGDDPAPALPAELHGALSRDRCDGCGARSPAGPLPPAPALPRCAHCGGLLRPDVVLFGEPLDGDTLHRARAMAVSADLCVVIGTSAEVHPAAAIPLATVQGGGRIVEINPHPTPLSRVAAVAVRGRAGAAVGAVLGGSSRPAPGP